MAEPDSVRTGPHRHVPAWLHALPPDSVARNLLVTTTIATVAALSVALAAVTLKPRIDAQRAALARIDRDRLVEIMPGLAPMLAQLAHVDFFTRRVTLDTGCFIATAGDGEQGPAMDIHLVGDPGAPSLLILPVEGPGYRSTLKAWLALGADLRTIEALDVYEQAETPGIGSRVQDPGWLASWQGKQLDAHTGSGADDTSHLHLADAAGDDPTAIDAISGATRTGRGVVEMVRVWTGAAGFGPLLGRLREGNPC